MFAYLIGRWRLPNIDHWSLRIAKTKLLEIEDKEQGKTYIRRFEAAIVDGDITAAKDIYPEVTKQIDMATSKGVVHKNAANRMKSKLAIKLNELEKSDETSA